MVSLVDLLGAKQRAETVTVLGQEVPVRSLTLQEIMDLVWRFPPLRKLIAARTLDAEELMQAMPQAIGAVIAAGFDLGGNEAEEAAASQLPLPDQINVLEAILRLTAPGGVVPLVQTLARMMGASDDDFRAALAPATSSPPPSTS